MGITTSKSQIDAIFDDLIVPDNFTTITKPTFIDKCDYPSADPKLQCKICNINLAQCVTIPCGCKWLCYSCVNNYSSHQNTYCKICNNLIQGIY